MSVKKARLSKADLLARRKRREEMANMPIRFELRWAKKGEKVGADAQLIQVITPNNKERKRLIAEGSLAIAQSEKHTMKTWRATGRSQGYNDPLYCDSWVIVPIREPLENDLGPVHP